jgi:hypothetical protein
MVKFCKLVSLKSLFCSALSLVVCGSTLAQEFKEKQAEKISKWKTALGVYYQGEVGGNLGVSHVSANVLKISKPSVLGSGLSRVPIGIVLHLPRNWFLEQQFAINTYRDYQRSLYDYAQNVYPNHTITFTSSTENSMASWHLGIGKFTQLKRGHLFYAAGIGRHNIKFNATELIVQAPATNTYYTLAMLPSYSRNGIALYSGFAKLGYALPISGSIAVLGALRYSLLPTEISYQFLERNETTYQKSIQVLNYPKIFKNLSFSCGLSIKIKDLNK